MKAFPSMFSILTLSLALFSLAIYSHPVMANEVKFTEPQVTERTHIWDDMNNVVKERLLETSHGTLNVVLATTRFIVVATDSRRTYDTADYEDNSKKLFVVGKKRILAIAGLVEASLKGLPWLTAQIAPLLDIHIARSYQDDYIWNGPLLPEELPEKLKQYWGEDLLYSWWTSLHGPVQTIFNIALTYGDVDLNRYRLEGLLAGFKDNGEAKIARLVIVPKKGVSSWGRPHVGIARSYERTTTSGPLIWKTAGVTELADTMLGGVITDKLKRYVRKYPGISTFLRRRETNSVESISEAEMIVLAKDLIRATASRDRRVGSEPIQIATVRPNEEVVVEQPSFPQPSILVPSQGTWHLGVVFTPEHPFDEARGVAVYTFCEIKNNKKPIPLGNNHFYGNTFDQATFIYMGGLISFGNNNRVTDSKLIIAPDVDETPLKPILKYFTHVERP